MKTLCYHSEITKHLRRLIAKEGIKARVRKLKNSATGIQVFTVAHEVAFTEDEQRFIRFIAKLNHLTLVRGMEIDVLRMTDPRGMEFYLSQEGRVIWEATTQKFPNPSVHQDRQQRTA